MGFIEIRAPGRAPTPHPQTESQWHEKSRHPEKSFLKSNCDHCIFFQTIRSSLSSWSLTCTKIISFFCSGGCLDFGSPTFVELLHSSLHRFQQQIKAFSGLCQSFCKCKSGAGRTMFSCLPQLLNSDGCSTKLRPNNRWLQPLLMQISDCHCL